MEQDYEYASSVHLEDLEDPERLGRRCGERAVRRLHPRKVSSAQVPIVFEPRVARSLLGHLTAAINGSAVARGTTFLHDKLGEPVFAPASASSTIRYGGAVSDPAVRRRGHRVARQRRRRERGAAILAARSARRPAVGAALDRPRFARRLLAAIAGADNLYLEPAKP